MVEINQLYRTIAQSTEQLEQLKGHGGFSFMNISAFTGGVILMIVSLIFGGLFFFWPALQT